MLFVLLLRRRSLNRRQSSLTLEYTLNKLFNSESTTTTLRWRLFLIHNNQLKNWWKTKTSCGDFRIFDRESHFLRLFLHPYFFSFFTMNCPLTFLFPINIHLLSFQKKYPSLFKRFFCFVTNYPIYPQIKKKVDDLLLQIQRISLFSPGFWILLELIESNLQKTIVYKI